MSRRRSRYVPAILSAFVPGLGHLVAGRRREGLVFLAPIVALGLLWIVVAVVSGPARVAGALVDSGVLWGLLGLQLLLMAWRLLATWSSLTDRRMPPLARRDVVPVAALVGLIVIPTAWAMNVTNVARETAEEVFVETATGGAWVPPSPSPGVSTTPDWRPALPSIPVIASPSPSPMTERINGLVIGVDAGVGRNTYLTDTMIVVSLDPATESVSLVSVPRDLVDVPLPDGKRYRGKINGLVSQARHNPSQFPGSDGTGVDVLMAAIGQLLQIRIDYYALVTLGGFIPIIDKLGGVDVHVDRAFCDPGYDEYGFSAGFSITAGWHHLNGKQALAYARVRKAAGESDFTRAARQQEVLSGIRDAVVAGRFLNDPVGLLKAAAKTVSTNVPRAKIGELLDHATRVGRGRTYRGVLVGSGMIRAGHDSRGYILLADLAKVRSYARSLFPTDGSLPAARFRSDVEDRTGGGSGSLSSGVAGCRPAATPRPSPRPSPTPSPSASPSASTSPEPSATAPTPSPSASSSPEPSATSPTPEPLPTPEPSPSPPPSPSG
jgi:LCP family protein required for cell wall assembly